MKRIIIVGIIIGAFLSVSAQTQQGYVRTLGRPEKSGVALEGVTVRVEGVHNAVLSGKDGRFQMPMTGKHKGDSYSLQQVQKNGYEPADPNLVGRKYAYSDRVPLTVVMVSKAQLQADKRRIADAAYQTAERNYRQQLDVLERRLSDSSISEGTYRKKLQELQENLERYQELVEGLADHYAHTDYDLLDDKEREVNICIERGELERADSLLATMFNPQGVLERNRDAFADADRRLAEGQEMMELAQNDLAAVLRQQEKDAEYLYQLYTIALARFDNEKARQYIENRAALDTTNVEWQFDAGNFNLKYLGEYSESIRYYDRELSIEGIDSLYLLNLYNNIAIAYKEIGMYGKSLEYNQKALALRIDFLGEKNLDVAQSYRNIGAVYLDMREFDKASEYFDKEIGVLKELNKEDYATYSNLGVLFAEKGDYARSIENLGMAIDLIGSSTEKDSLEFAPIYNNFGGVYVQIGDYNNALLCFMKQKEILEKHVSEKHPDLAKCYKNIGILYIQLDDYENAILFFDKSLAICRQNGFSKLEVATIYGLIGDSYLLKGMNTMALNNYNEALLLFGNDSLQKLCEIYYHMGLAYKNINENNSALEKFLQSKDVMEKISLETFSFAVDVYENIGQIYALQDSYKLAIDYCTKAYNYLIVYQGENFEEIRQVSKYIAMLYYSQDAFSKAIEYFEISLENLLKKYEQNISKAGDFYDLYFNIAGAYFNLSNYELAVEYFRKAYDLGLSVAGENHSLTVQAKEYLDSSILKLNECSR